ncbi:uncharacterized protein E0L32_002491 [Thyridium curvatum]|uniref:Glycosyltransferase family 32 protein n=1 Tax=Thyridium curvatum TaxID=1093900 RepID=A0A507BIP1_9PEZI|nr:uncharacterized protein E0L32_002491 [Thyridium curvatum]TPX18634.1 hypothetical protein E0L32_002491 [Thyridium curvatum]
MLMLTSYIRMRSRRLLVPVIISVIACWSVWAVYAPRTDPTASVGPSTYKSAFPLAWEHIHMFNGTGGAWYIPDDWIDDKRRQPTNILEAARLASRAAEADHLRQVDQSLIPLIVHQTWAVAQIDTWGTNVLSCVEKWLRYAVLGEYGSPMAYLFWDDDGMLAFVEEYEPDFVEPFITLFTPVERADIFRILVCKWFGGIYGDVDTEPLQHPAKWIRPLDVAPWTDPETEASWGQKPADGGSKDVRRPVRLLVGLEADTDPALDTYWRMGYSYPVQLTQWALASAPQHPALSRFMDDVQSEVDVIVNMTVHSGAGSTEIAQIHADPLTRTGPAAITAAVSRWLEEHVGLRWNAVTGLKDGGKSKLVADVLVLPITGFSPGRGQYGNMGSKPASDPDARLLHHAQGSWRHFDLKVELGKLCRTMFGLCRDWSKVPS